MEQPTSHPITAANVTLTGADADKQKFCQLWPNVKEGLTLLQNILKNPIAKMAVGVVISAGDGIAGIVCGH